MKATYLVPNHCKIYGWILFVVGICGGIAMYITDFEAIEALKVSVFTIYSDPILSKPSYFTFIENGIFDELVSIFLIVGGLLIGFSKEKVEDEFIYKLRKDSLVWALIVNYSILLFAILFIYDMTFMHILLFNMFTPLLFFIFRFTLLKSRYLRYEE